MYLSFIFKYFYITFIFSILYIRGYIKLLISSNLLLTRYFFGSLSKEVSFLPINVHLITPLKDFFRQFGIRF